MSLVLANSCYADAKAISCPTLKLTSADKNILLDSTSTSTAQIYLLKNNSTKSIWLDHPVKKASASAGWSSYLRPGNWSAIVVDKKDFALSCSVIQPGKVESLDCAQAITACSRQPLELHSTRKGTYWLIEDKSYEDVMKVLQKKTK